MVLVPVYRLCLFFIFFAQNRLFLKKEKRKKGEGKKGKKKKKKEVYLRACVLFSIFIPKPLCFHTALVLDSAQPCSFLSIRRPSIHFCSR